MTKILIDVNALKEDVNNADVVVMDKQIFNTIIDAQKVVEERPTAEWLSCHSKIAGRYYVCTNCYWNVGALHKSKWCPHCGAYMGDDSNEVD